MINLLLITAPNLRRVFFAPREWKSILPARAYSPIKSAYSVLRRSPEMQVLRIPAPMLPDPATAAALLLPLVASEHGAVLVNLRDVHANPAVGILRVKNQRVTAHMLLKTHGTWHTLDASVKYARYGLAVFTEPALVGKFKRWKLPTYGAITALSTGVDNLGVLRTSVPDITLFRMVLAHIGKEGG
jgi:hypothetical protein